MSGTRLPEDIWRLIFQLLATDSAVSQEETSASLGSVCRFWREIVLDLPVLWTEVTASVRPCQRAAEVQVAHVRGVLERARHRPVAVNIRPTQSVPSGLHRVSAQLLGALVPHISHISHLDIRGSSAKCAAISLSFNGIGAFPNAADSAVEMLFLDTPWSCTGAPLVDPR